MSGTFLFVSSFLLSVRYVECVNFAVWSGCAVRENERHLEERMEEKRLLVLLLRAR